MSNFDNDMSDFLTEYSDQSITPDFESSGEAYDRIQWDDHIRTGRIFTVESEKIVGIAWAWPIAVTAEHGELSSTKRDPRQWKDEEPKIATSVAAALELARCKGWTLADWARP
jgi:hypothetical protein